MGLLQSLHTFVLELVALIISLFTLVESAHWNHHADSDITADYPALPTTECKKQDMTQPLPHYWISSGHNTYLTGNQLWSKSGAGPIRDCLRRGCKVVELDAYDAVDPKKGPICYHGYTLTRPVLFEECVAAIAAHAFDASPYPVIISLEDHTNPENQRRLAEILLRLLGNKLHVPDEDECRNGWHSPEELKYKVLVRTPVDDSTTEEMMAITYAAKCRFQHYHDDHQDVLTSPEFAESKAPNIIEYQVSALLEDHPLVNGTWATDVAPAGTEEDSPYESIQSGKEDQGEDTEGGPDKGGFGRSTSDTTGTKDTNAPRPAMTRTKSAPAAAAAGPKVHLVHVLRYNSLHLTRIYPSGLRVDSSNVDPAPHFAAGVPVVSLNWQNWDRGMRINSTKFLDNGGCGYLLKPRWMVDSQAGAKQRLPSVLQVKVLSAHSRTVAISFWKPDLFVQVEVVGTPADTSKKCTRVAHNTGRLVANETFKFETLFPEMAQLLIELRDDDNIGSRLIGYFGVPLNSLIPGRYKLQLLDSKGHKHKIVAHQWIKVDLQWLVSPEQAAAGQTYTPASVDAAAPPAIALPAVPATALPVAPGLASAAAAPGLRARAGHVAQSTT